MANPALGVRFNLPPAIGGQVNLLGVGGAPPHADAPQLPFEAEPGSIITDGCLTSVAKSTLDIATSIERKFTRLASLPAVNAAGDDAA
jgi:hypothetical protein